MFKPRWILLYEQKFFCLHQTFKETQRNLRLPFFVYSATISLSNKYAHNEMFYLGYFSRS